MNKNVQVTLYKGTEPLLIATDVHKEIKAALNVKVNMPSGGYLFIQTTEALTVIDVNSGKFTSSATQDETILKTNIEAVHEIARQLRLRNIGGMIIVDFIDMLSRADKLAIMEELEIALEPDKAKPQVGQLSDLGLVELTRHRQGQSLSEIFTKKCPHCQGTGYFMNDFNFASPTAEGEYRAKAAKMKLPVNNFKKNNKKDNKNQNQPQNQPVAETLVVEEMTQAPVEIETENPSTVAIQETEKRENKRKRGGRKNKFEKKSEPEVQEPAIETAETVLKPNEGIKPVMDVVEPVESKAQEEIKSEDKAEVKEETPQVVKQEETSTEEKTDEKPKRTRRPNRGASKTRKTRTKKTNEEKVEE